MTDWDDFHGANAGYIQELYERYCENPEALDEETRAFFRQWRPPEAAAAAPAAESFDKIIGAMNLAQAVRALGHLAARIDPLGAQPPHDPALDRESYGLSEDDLARMPASLAGGPVAEGAANADEAIAALRAIYCAKAGFDFEHVTNAGERRWLRDAIETRHFRPPADPIDEKALLDRLTQVEIFERFLHRAFPGKYRFSIEGLDAMVPMLDEAVHAATSHGIGHLLIGMAHRGRLNVLAHILRRPYRNILAEFKDPLGGMGAAPTELGWTGDVKYHAGTEFELKEGGAGGLLIRMAPNPSHLEFINPVVMGMARAVSTRVDRPGPPEYNHAATLTVLIHGDAAFPGQGIVAESLNMSRLIGYRIGGSLHIIANNQLGFTAGPAEARSTMYASDLAKGFEIPIIHVNADEPVDCIEAMRIALAYRRQFQKDFLIDLVGYRRWGHNEADDPGFTQPVLYQAIDAHPTVRQLMAERMKAESKIDAEMAARLERKYMDHLQRELDTLNAEAALDAPLPKEPPPGAARAVNTAVATERILKLNAALGRLPQGFHIHSRLEKVLARRREEISAGGERAIDWTSAEELALGSILEDGIAVRFTGQDVLRGTFTHRHAVYFDQHTGAPFCPLQGLPQARAAFEIRNSPLSEAGAVGFEYGYNMERPERLVIWEAQYGDFADGAQVMIDEFLVSARAKWGQTPSLVLLLPHGFEGAGPDHSSGRIERFLDMAAGINMRVANCTTAAQYFHLLRRQALLLATDPLPLVVMTPKSLLRNPLVASPLSALAEARWQPVIDDAHADPNQVRRLILCSGKIYFDLIGEQKEPTPGLAVARVEQLYLPPKDELAALIEKYRSALEIVWLQEEPMNMGAWPFMMPVLMELIHGRKPLRYLGRPRYSSPAEGSAAWHAYNQKKLIEKARSIQ
ncbi:2-oxoglutarate dehydrogenase E1 component [bacterium]|nr:2-oxoglutarate dehydrogenase E1 component [bacterium]